MPITQAAEGGVLEVVEDRTAHRLFNQMVSLYVSRSEQVPLSLTRFRDELAQRYRLVDGMFFLAEQEAVYLRRKQRAGKVQQQSLVPIDEVSTIEWLRRELNARPQKLSDLTATFHSKNTGWRTFEQPVELLNMLKQNFFRYESGPIPTAVWAWMAKSATLREAMEGVARETPTAALMNTARDLWYVPNPDDETELANLRRAQLLREFDGYLEGTKKLKQFRTEALRAGFERAWKEKSYEAIMTVGGRIPEEVLAEDPKLLKLYNMSRMKTGG